MTIDAEAIADRRRLRRKLSFWRVVGILALILTVGIVGYLGGQSLRPHRRPGPCGADFRQRVHLRQPAPGGPDGAGRKVAVGVRRGRPSTAPAAPPPARRSCSATSGRLSAKKPLVAFVDGTAASGGYITAIAADHIVARETSLVGSIGVLFQYPDLSGLLGQVGVKVEEVKSAPLKAEPSPFKPTSPEARAALESVVKDTYDWFKRIVRERRGMSDSELAAASTGQIFSGHQGVPDETRRRDRRRTRRGGVARTREGRSARICRFATGSRAATGTSRCSPGRRRAPICSVSTASARHSAGRPPAPKRLSLTVSWRSGTLRKNKAASNI